MKRGMSVIALCVLLSAAGCVGSKSSIATVTFNEKYEPKNKLDEKYYTIAVIDAQVGGDTAEFDQHKWSSLTADMVRGCLGQAAEKHNIPIKLVDREHLTKTMGEKDLAAAGVTDSGNEIAAAKVEGAKAILTTKVTIKIDKQVGHKRTIDALSAFGAGWSHGGAGGGGVSSSEVEEESRNITVSSQFQLKDAATNEIIFQHYANPEQSYSKNHASPFFGSSKTEANMTPRDKIIGDILERQAMAFLGKFVPTEVETTVEVKSGGSDFSKAGVKALVMEDWNQALAEFKQAISEKDSDAKSYFGAGVCCEKLNRLDDARKYYKLAQSLDTDEPKYREAVQRVTH